MDRSFLIIGSTLVLGLTLVGWWVVASRSPAENAAPITYIDDVDGDMSTYVEVRRVAILTSENFVGHRIRVVEGTLGNLSDRSLRSVELSLSFNGFDGQVVLETEEEALRMPLPAGGEEEFTLRFENLPAGWNFRVPDIQVSRIGY